MDPLKLSSAEVELLPEAQAIEVLAAHVKARQSQLPEALAASSSKPLARAAKKALYQLRSSGVELAEPAAAAPAPQQPAATASGELPGLLSPVLGGGEQMVIFGRPVRAGGVELYQGVLHDEFGVQQLDRADANRSKYRRQLRLIVKGERVFEVPFSRILAELARAWGQNLRAKNGLPQAAYENLHRLRVTPDETQLEVPRPEADDAALAAAAEALHDQPEIKAWLPAEEQLAALAQLRAQKPEPAALEQGVGQLADEHFTTGVRQLYARRLWRMAEFFDATERAEAARLARAVARTLCHELPTGGPFGRRLFQKAIAL